MRVLHVTHQYYPAIGGSERYITDLSEGLARNGHAVDVYTTRSLDYHTWANALPPTRKSAEAINGVRVWRFSAWRRTDFAWRMLALGLAHYWSTGWRLFEPLIYYGNGPVAPGLFWAVLRRARRYDLVHINQLHYAHAYTAYAAARARGVPIVLTPHLHAEQRATYDVGYLHTMLAQSNALFAVSRGEQAFMLRLAPEQMIVLGGNGLALERYPPRSVQEARARFGLPAEAFVMLFLGRKTAYKGLEPCLRAFLALRAQRSDVYFLAIGPETDFSRQLWAVYGAREGLIIRDTVLEAEKLDALAACNVLAMPSTGEAFGIVYLEAWAYARPVIGANIQAVASLIDEGVDGFLVNPDEPEQLLRCLSTLADNPHYAQALGGRGQTKLRQRYTIERITQVVEATYHRVLRYRRSQLQPGGARGPSGRGHADLTRS
jgi:glycosyltransferase involved in cell wall biosynthesis